MVVTPEKLLVFYSKYKLETEVLPLQSKSSTIPEFINLIIQGSSIPNPEKHLIISKICILTLVASTISSKVAQTPSLSHIFPVSLHSALQIG